MNPHDELEAYVLGALEDPGAAAFEAHLPSCSACRDGIASYGGVLRALRALPVAAAPPPPRVGRTPIGWIAAVAAAAVLGIAVGQRTVPVRADGDVAAIAEMIAVQPREIALAGTSARGAAIVGSGGARTAFVVSGLPAPPAGRGYQVWVRGANVRSPGMMHRTTEGLEVLVVPGDALAGAHRIGITVEPAGGSPARTGPAQVTGKVS
ncbi:MAG TPA: anti-sigma factor [Candidatus Elarobacter sp.]